MRGKLVGAGLVVAVLATSTPSTGGPTGYAARSIAPEDLRPKFETNVAVDPRDARRVVVTAIQVEPSYVDRYVREAPRPVAHLWVSRDGGRSFRPGGPLPALPGLAPSSNDPTLAWGHDGTLWASYTAFHPGSDPAAGAAGLYVASSRDGGATWRRGGRVEGFGCGGPDRSTVAVDPVRHWVYVAWVHYEPLSCDQPRAIDSSKTVVRWSRSTDGGRTFSTPVDASEPGGTAEVTPGVLPDGTLLVATLEHRSPLLPHASCGGTASQVRVKRYDRQGRLSGDGYAIPELCEVQGLSANGSAMIPIRHPAVAVDPVTGRVSVAAPLVSATQSGVAVATSADGGRSFAQVVVTGAPGSTATLTALSAGSRGLLALVYLEVQPGGLYYPVLSRSSDGGRSFSPPVRLVDEASTGNARARQPYDPYNIGHYLGVAVGPDGVAHAAWPDLRARPGSPLDVDLWVRGVPLR